MKVTTEKLPRSLIALDIELDREQVEKGLERAARRLSSKYNIPGFRKGKAPRFIIENYFGRSALIEEASDDILQKSFQEALKQTGINPVASPNLESFHITEEPYSMRVTVPVSPSVELPDYKTYRFPLKIEEITDDMVERGMIARRDKHAVLRELEEARPAAQGDEVSAELEAFVDGEPLEPRPEGQPLEPSSLILEPDRLVDGLYDGLLGATVGQTLQIISQMADDHSNEKLRGKEVTFAVNVLGIKERLLPEWDELPMLEEFDGTLDELREKTRAELIESAKSVAERQSVNDFTTQLLEQSSFDIPDALIERQADLMLQDQEQEYTRYGITPEQVYQYRGQKREDLLQELLPQAESRIKSQLALSQVVRNEGLTVNDDDIAAELEVALNSYDENQRDQIRAILASEQYRPVLADTALDKKLRAHLLVLATAPVAEEGEEQAAAEVTTPTAETVEE